MAKGKIICVGGGFGGEYRWDFAEYIIGLSGKEKPHYLLIPTTGYDFSEGSIDAFSKMGCECDVLCLTHPYITEQIIADYIERADVIQVPGGNLKFCMDVWNRTGAGKYLKKAFDDGKVLFGESSGSMCWFRQGFDDCAPRGEFMFVDCLDLIPFCNVPHYETEWWNSFGEYASKTPLSTVCCENNTALCYIDGEYSVKVCPDRPDARVWYFDAEDGYKRYDLTSHPEILKKMSSVK